MASNQRLGRPYQRRQATVKRIEVRHYTLDKDILPPVYVLQVMSTTFIPGYYARMSYRPEDSELVETTILSPMNAPQLRLISNGSLEAKELLFRLVNEFSFSRVTLQARSTAPLAKQPTDSGTPAPVQRIERHPDGVAQINFTVAANAEIWESMFFLDSTLAERVIDALDSGLLVATL